MKSTNPQKQPLLFWMPLALLFLAVIVLFTLHFTDQPKIVYINTNKLLLEYQGVKDAQVVLQSKSKTWEANMDTLAMELKKSVETFEKTKASMSKRELKLNEELIQTKRSQFMQYKEAVNEKAMQEDQQLQKSVLDKINTFMKEYGRREGYAMILGATNVGNIVYAEEITDVTDEVLIELNAAYTKSN